MNVCGDSQLDSNDDCDDGSDTFTSCLDVDATVGVVYYIQVDGYFHATGTVALYVDLDVAPVNDNFAASLALVTETAVDGTNRHATVENNELITAYGEDSVWYNWTANDSYTGPIGITLSGACDSRVPCVSVRIRVNINDVGDLYAFGFRGCVCVYIFQYFCVRLIVIVPVPVIVAMIGWGFGIHQRCVVVTHSNQVLISTQC